MKPSLQKRSLRAAGLAIAIALGLAAASHSAQAAILQYTLSGGTGTITGTLGGTPFSAANWSITATADSANSAFYAAGQSNGVAAVPGPGTNQTFAPVYYITTFVSAPVITIGTGPSALTATLLNFGIESRDYRFGNGDAAANLFSSQLDGVEYGPNIYVDGTFAAFNDLKSIGTFTGPSGFDVNTFGTSSGNLVATSSTVGAGGTFQISASSTAVPEPGTFLPAAALVMGALLRRRRPRSHRSGRATA